MITTKKVILTSREVLDYCPTLTTWSLEKAIREQRFPYFKIGRKRYFDKDKIDEWFDLQIDKQTGLYCSD